MATPLYIVNGNFIVNLAAIHSSASFYNKPQTWCMSLKVYKVEALFADQMIFPLP